MSGIGTGFKQVYPAQEPTQPATTVHQAKQASAPVTPPPPPPGQPAVIWGEFDARLAAKGRRFEDIRSAADKTALLRSLGFTDPLDLASLETEWTHRLAIAVSDALGTTAAQPLNGGRDTAAALLEFFTAQERRTQQKWRPMAERLATQRQTLLEATITDRRALFADLAKNAMLSADDVIAGMYTLYADSTGQQLYVGFLLATNGLARVQAHNFYVASLLPATFLETFGDLLGSCPWPLFPPDPAFGALNQKLLHEVKGADISGGAQSATLPSVFRHDSPSGGTALPVSQNQAGNLEVDMTLVEQAFNEVYQQMSVLQREVKALKEGGEKLTAPLATLRNLLGRTRASVRDLKGPRNYQRGPNRAQTRTDGRYRGGPRGAGDQPLGFS